MTVLKPPNSSSLFTFRAAAWGVQINIGTPSSPIWTFLRGLSKFEPKQDPKMADDTDIDSDGWESELVAAQKLNIDVEGLVKGEKSTSLVIPDPGVSHLRKLGKEKGYENIAHLRYWRLDDINEAYEHYFALKYSDAGGGNADLQKFSATLSGRGKPTEISKPQATDVNEIQSITIVGTATGGTAKLGFLGQPTGSLTLGTLTVTALETALTGLSTIGTGNVAVSGNPGGPWAVTFGGSLAARDVPSLEVVENLLTPSGASQPKVEIKTVVQGAKA